MGGEARGIKRAKKEKKAGKVRGKKVSESSWVGEGSPHPFPT